MEQAIGKQVALITAAALRAAQEQKWASLPALMEPVSRNADRAIILCELSKWNMTSISLALLTSSIPWLPGMSESEWKLWFKCVGGDHAGVYHLNVFLIQSGGLTSLSLMRLYARWAKIDKIYQFRSAFDTEEPSNRVGEERVFDNTHGYLGLTQDHVRAFRSYLHAIVNG